jgi:hypothetical protein
MIADIHISASNWCDEALDESIAACSGHRAQMTREEPFRGSVRDPAGENPAAHGCIRVVEFCRCGAERHRNVNGGHVEQGVWH